MAFPQCTNVFHSSPYLYIDLSCVEPTTGKIIFITGGGTSLGPHLAHAFAKLGATTIAINGRTEATLLSNTSAVETQHPGVSVLALIVDISDQGVVNTAFAIAHKIFRPVNILVSNAGNISDILPLATTPLDEFTKGLHVNAQQEHISTSHLGMGVYSISKLAAVKMLGYIEAGNPHVRTVTVHRGVMNPSMNKKCNDAGVELPIDHIELAASFVVWVTSPEWYSWKGSSCGITGMLMSSLQSRKNWSPHHN